MKLNFKMRLLCGMLALSLLMTACGSGDKEGTEAGTLVNNNGQNTQVEQGNTQATEDQQEEVLTAEEKEWQNFVMPDVEVSLRIRKEASIESDVVGVLDRGSRATVIEKGKEWTKIKSGEVEGYVSNEFCKYGKDALALAKEVCKKGATCTTDSLNIRQKPDANATVLDKLENGESIELAEKAEAVEGWVAVNYYGMTAYVSAQYVTVGLKIGEALTMDEVYAREKAYEYANSSNSSGSSGSSGSTTPQPLPTVTTINSPVIAAASEYEVLAAMVWCESGNQSYECNLAVASVIMNRVRGGYFPGSVKQVVFQDGQFPPATCGILEDCLKNKKTTENCYKAATAAMNGEDNTDGCLYFNTYKGTQEGLRIGAMVFWKTWK